ncbi:TorF family putative porin [Brevundimonas sp. Root1279]|uniref:TorF family putative porin n=1 Tax=Brevundimonas sp. Root1279 TaxID=1736443 RepID=UPI000A6639BF|nr:TorF family putative porin [Brevundimonas sp. Root1279]
MMRTAFLSAAALAAALMAAPAASAQEVDVAFNAGVVSDYVFRGFSQSNEDSAVQGGVDVTAGSFYAGAWASEVDFGDTTDFEVDLYGGYRTEAAGVALDFGVVAYLYTDTPDDTDYDYVELKAGASRAFGPVTVGGVVYWSPDFFGVDEETTYVEGSLAFVPAEKWTLSGALGYQSLDVSDDYTTWNAGVGYALAENLLFDVRYYDTDVDVPIAEDRVVAGVKILF